jgi:hypothetical protein
MSERGLRLFAQDVLPVLKTWAAAKTAEAAD